MKVTVHFSYTASKIPKRCRIPRSVRCHDGSLRATIPEVSSAEAPVAIEAVMSPISKGAGMLVQYRWYRGSLWASVHLAGTDVRTQDADGTSFDLEPLPEVIDVADRNEYKALRMLGGYYNASNSKEDAARFLRSMLRSRLLVDGVMHQVVSEPRYVVTTFGLGSNHGGTALMTDGWFNPNVGRNSYFSLLELDAALAAAEERAKSRGDTKSLPISVNGPAYTVLLPDAIRVRVKRKAKH